MSNHLATGSKATALGGMCSLGCPALAGRDPSGFPRAPPQSEDEEGEDTPPLSPPGAQLPLRRVSRRGSHCLPRLDLRGPRAPSPRSPPTPRAPPCSPRPSPAAGWPESARPRAQRPRSRSSSSSSSHRRPSAMGEARRRDPSRWAAGWPGGRRGGRAACGAAGQRDGRADGRRSTPSTHSSTLGAWKAAPGRKWRLWGGGRRRLRNRLPRRTPPAAGGGAAGRRRSGFPASSLRRARPPAPSVRLARALPPSPAPPRGPGARGRAGSGWASPPRGGVTGPWGRPAATRWKRGLLDPNKRVHN